MDKKAQLYWKDHQLWRFVQFGIHYNDRTDKDELMGVVEHNGWKFFAACDGAILVVDAAQGVEAQTLANVYLALDHDLDVVPVINKIDLPAANIENTKQQIENVIGIPCDEAPCISAKTGLNVKDVLEQIVKNAKEDLKLVGLSDLSLTFDEDMLLVINK